MLEFQLQLWNRIEQRSFLYVERPFHTHKVQKTEKYAIADLSEGSCIANNIQHT